MKSTVDNFAAGVLLKWVAFIQGKPQLVLGVLASLTVLFASIAVMQLGINSNNLDLLSPKMESRVYQAEFSAVFPDIENALLVVVDAQSGQLAKNSADALSQRLNQNADQIESAYIPGGGEFFDTHGLRYLDLETLQGVSKQLQQLRPFIISLEANPTLAGLADLIVKNMRVTRFNFDYEETWAPLLDHLTQVTDAALRGQASAASGANESLFSSAVSLAHNTRQVIVVNPVLEFGNILAANRAIKSIRNTAETLGLNADNGVTVRVTGNPALNLEEMIGIAWDVGIAGIFCFALVIIVLTFALRSFPLVVASVATLLVGLIWTAGLAALLVGHLNIVSLSVAILFIGLGVDFAIHLGMSYADSLRRGLSEELAMRESITKIGSSLFICTISTAIGFAVFIPTAYLGVAELGLIAATGMVVIFFLTVTLFPALLISWLRFDPERHIKSSLKFEASLGVWVQKHSSLVISIAALLLLAGLYIAPKAQFDPNVIDMRDPSTESVQVFNELLDESGLASPWHIDALLADLESAKTLAEQTSQLPTVSQSVTISDFIPKHQPQKDALLLELAKQFKPLKKAPANQVKSTEEQVGALARLREHLLKDVNKSDTQGFADKETLLAEKLAALIQDTETKNSTALDTVEKELLAELPQQLNQLRISLNSKQIELAALPENLRARMVAPDGQARVKIYPSENLTAPHHLREFVASVQSMVPRATGMAVNLVAFEQATKQSFYQALFSAFVLITLLLMYLWRNLIDVLLVLSPLILSLLLAVSCMALIGLPFNFTNVIVIPLLFGIGVDSGIHLVHRSHGKAPSDLNLLNTTTARAVFYSALSTFVSFGSLSFSSHQGMSSLGTLLAIGMVLTVLCNLVVLPALLNTVRKAR